jgi:hypothetical protein
MAARSLPIHVVRRLIESLVLSLQPAEAYAHRGVEYGGTGRSAQGLSGEKRGNPSSVVTRRGDDRRAPGLGGPVDRGGGLQSVGAFRLISLRQRAGRKRIVVDAGIGEL